jgi:long-chain acyl-CoA synthetase
MFPTLSFGDAEYSPERMSSRVSKVAGALTAAGINEGDTIAFMLRNEPAAMELMLAARQIGAYFTPLNWHFKSEEAGYILQDSGAKVLVAHADLLPQIIRGVPSAVKLFVAQPHPYIEKSPGPKGWDGSKDWNSMVEGASPNQRSNAVPRGLIAYTSGTTGKPKGVRRLPPNPGEAAELSHAIATMLRTTLGITASSRCLVSAPLYHSAPCGYVMFASLSSAWLRIEPRFDAAQTLELIEQYRITHSYLVPTMYIRLLRLPDEVKNRHDLSSIEFVSSTGATCPQTVKEAMINWWGDVINETYGSSETGYMTFITSKEARARPGSAGRPIPGVSIAIHDDEGREVPSGTIGKIYVRSAMMPDFTYINRHGDREGIENKGYVTLGDLGYVDQDGYLFIADRRTDLVISGGVNIYPAEIEHVLIEMPGVSDCAVFGIPDPEFGQSLVAVVKPLHGFSLSQADVTDYLASRLASFKVPKIVEFKDELPREETGKIFRRRLRDEYVNRLEN